MAPVCVLPESVRLWGNKLLQHLQFKGLGSEQPKALLQLPLREQLRLACVAVAKDGIGTPVAIHGYYVLKAIAYIWGFWHCQRRHSGRWNWRRLCTDPTFSKDAFARLIIYNLLFEVLGFGCGSGPLAGRLVPPHTAWFHFLCPGTLKLPFRANGRDSRWPLLPGMSTRRNRFDVLLFAGYVAALLRALMSQQVTAAVCRPVCFALGLLAMVDHSVFLASRGDVYGYMAVAHAAGEATVGSQLVQLAVYFWAAFSKLGPWFNNVIQVMMSNSPIYPSRARRLLYYDLENHDFRPSALAMGLAILGTAKEASIPVLLLSGGRLSQMGLLLSVAMHSFIFANVAVGCPQEWNIFTPFAGWHLFINASNGLDWHGLHRLPTKRRLLSLFLALVLGVVPAVGNMYPPSNSFLTSMKYYAGNWSSTVWLVRRSAWPKFSRLHTLSAPSLDQASAVLGRELAEIMNLKVCAFRALHLPYRGLPDLVEKALNGRSFHEYHMLDGETMAAFILGYNFGDGYLHGRYMLQAVQDVCDFVEGDLLHIAIDSCPTLGSSVPWFIRDATCLWDDAKAIAIGSTALPTLQQTQPF